MTAGDVLKHLDQLTVAVAGGDLLVLEQRRGMRPGGAQAQAAGARVLGHPGAQPAQVGGSLADVPADDGAGLQHALHELRLQLLGEVAGRRLVQQILDLRNQLEGVAVEQHVLLLDTHGERVAGAEPVVEHAAAGAALAGWRGSHDEVLPQFVTEMFSGQAM